MKRLRMMAVVGALTGLWLLPAASSGAELRGGLVMTLNASFIHGADSNYFSGMVWDGNWFPRFSVGGGGFLTIQFSKTVAVQAEALLARKGSQELKGWSDYPTYKYRLNTSYLEIPFLIRLAALTSGSNRLYLIAGPALGIRLSGYLKRDSEKITIDGLKSTDLGLVLGIGLVRNSRASADLRYTMGLTKMIEQDGVILDIKNSVFSVVGRYTF
jgi:hypothetical protein